mmetsp:Transcript_15259/g.38521  ORF Transcript_15259/g.38521 Transcript_15259/m.38521 type:complete len:254 (-) Transcript_15259:320-1081(-)
MHNSVPPFLHFPRIFTVHPHTPLCSSPLLPSLSFAVPHLRAVPAQFGLTLYSVPSLCSISPIRDYIGSKQRGGDSEEMEGAKVEEGPSAMDFFRSPTSKAATPSSSHARGKALFSPSSSSKLRPSPHSASKGSSKTLPAGGLKAGRSGYDLISNDDGAFRADDFVGVLDSAHTPTASPPPLKSSLSIHANHLPTSSPATSVEVVEAEAAKVLSSQKKRLKAKAKRLRFDANTSSHTHWTRTKTPLTSISFATE